MVPKSSNEIRQAFLDFFAEMNHQVVPSSPLPIQDNPTLLFTNAGMNQFADVFLGKETRPYRRVASCQKCMRVQGKHNDLENVGPSPRHHTFFEMLGNFSFGDYFKEGAIRYAYDFMTTVCKIDAYKLWYTVHRDDPDAYRIWIEEIGVDPDRVLRMGDKTNFWMMGDIGPCGPTSEIHYDWGPEYCTCHRSDCSVALDNDCGRWLEVWNLVFMQYNQDEDGKRTPLPSPGVDTGLGLERITSVVEQKPVNYDTDLFVPAMDRIQELLDDTAEQRESKFVGYRVIADHGRAATFLLADGVLPGNVGRGYVLRMIIRRAARYGRKIGFSGPFLGEIAKTYIEQMGTAYSELETNQEHILHTIALEEQRFARTLDSALAQLDDLLFGLEQQNARIIPGDDAFDLYATHGLPLEITRDVAAERGFEVDEAAFLEAREKHALASGTGAFGRYEKGGTAIASLLKELIAQGMLEQSGVDYDPYSVNVMESDVIAVIEGGEGEDSEEEQLVGIVTSATPFYVEAGGEVGDTGVIRHVKENIQFEVAEVVMPIPGLVVHYGSFRNGFLKVGDPVWLEVDRERRWDIRRNHTATHILHKELRSHLGKHVTQQGSLVAPDRLRFDFSHGEAVGKAKLQQIEAAINEIILKNEPVNPEHLKREAAIKSGAMALFGEKYGEIVRTIKIGDEDDPYSFELCGGLHVNATGDIGSFHFTGEEAVGAGLRRVEAVTGRGALQLFSEREKTLERISSDVNAPLDEIAVRVAQIVDENRALQKEIARLRQRQARAEFESLFAAAQRIDGTVLVVAEVQSADMNTLREMADWFRDKHVSGVIALGAIKDEKPIFVVAVTEDLVAEGINAGDIVNRMARVVGGGGGGRPTLAQAGGKEPEKLDEALSIVPEVLKQRAANR